MFGLAGFLVISRLPLTGSWWIVGPVVVYAAIVYYTMNLRCPVCGGLASIRKSKRFGDYYGLGNTCAHCGADFHKV